MIIGDAEIQAIKTMLYEKEADIEADIEAHGSEYDIGMRDGFETVVAFFESRLPNLLKAEEI